VNPRKLLRVAKWEVTKNAGGIDRRTLVVAALAIGFIAVIAPLVAGQGAVLDEGLYRVGVSEDSPYYDVVESDDTFAVHDPSAEALEAGRIDLLVDGREVVATDTAKSRAAAEELRSSVQRYNNRRLSDPSVNQSAAFPVSVTLRYADQESIGSSVRIDAGDGSTGAGSGGTDGSDTDGGSGTTAGSDGTDGSSDSAGDTGGSAGDGSGDSTDGSTADGGDDSSGAGGAGGLGGLGSQLSGGDENVGSPSNISPPFPFQSLVLAFVFIIPLNFLIQAYGSTVLSERLNRRGELLLVSPVSRFDIIGGKTLPYFAAAMAIEGAIAVGLTYLSQGTIGGLVSLAAVAPVVLLFLAATFLGAMFARSFKELTFVTVTITVSLTSYAFVPAIFTDVNPIALISPLTIVVRDLQGQSIAATEFLFSVTPPLLSAFVLFGLGAGLYREEDMFAQRAIPLKVLDALAGRIHAYWHVGLLTMVLLPFVFVLELLAIATLFALQELSIPLVLVAVAVIEEVAKSLHVYAGYAHSRFSPGTVTALVVGAISGVGFFLAEKLTAIAQLVGLDTIQTGQAGLQTGLIQGSEPLLILAVSLLAPLLLHTVTAAISAVGASRNRRAYAVALVVAIAVHLAYNLAVLSVVTDLV
jgi:ABC-type Na+ efflux pump permease subunit